MTGVTHNSLEVEAGDIFLAFSTAPPDLRPDPASPLLERKEWDAEAVDPFYLAGVEAVEVVVVVVQMIPQQPRWMEGAPLPWQWTAGR